MKSTKTSFVNVVCVVVVMFVVLSGSSANAAYLNNQINLPDLKFGLNSSTQLDGRVELSANLATIDQITSMGVYFNRDAGNPLMGYASISFNGIVGVPATKIGYQRSSMSVDYRGFQASTGVDVSAYQQITDWAVTAPDGNGNGGGIWTPIYGDWMSTGSGQITLYGVTLLSSNGWYNEYTYKEGGYGEKGLAPAADDGQGTWVTDFSASAQFQLQFDSEEDAATFAGMGSTQVAVVPEPTTLGLMGLGIIGLIRRRRRQ